MNPHISLVVLAGGLGSRFGGAKQIAPLPGVNRTIMELSIEDAYNAGIRHLVLVINAAVRAYIEQEILPKLPEDLEVTLVEQRLEDVPTEYAQLAAQLAAERQKPWGTGHALLCAKEAVVDKAIVITADDYYGSQAYQQLVQHFKHSDNWACVAYPLQQTLSEQGGVNRGICALNEHQQLVRVDEVLNIQYQDDGSLLGLDDKGQARTLALDALASMTCWGIDKRLFTILAENFADFLGHHDKGNAKEYYLPDQIQYGIDQHLAVVDVYAAKQAWMGMTYKDELPLLARNIAALKGLSHK
ncbi:NTP transferase domain-containing protein [Pseudoalteromonas sp. T1lg48]|uniref:NTP transferase domain-containing protein n=1 Tax=Pseudoalteromonas sp. T1lg48 TaxID=2077100 RepID=UPI001F19ACF5|nr:NTP transferase domain-containing protein [Pseudoalteromonas sp. T1lg48]